jgi:broad specificity phosphatase PhoE
MAARGAVAECAVAGDYIPADLDPAGLPPSYARLVSSYTVRERKQGAALAQAAIERFARPPEESPAGPEESPAADVHELIVTHNFLIGWFVRHALDAPDWRWIGLNQQNCALTVLLYQPGLPPSLVSFNDAAHLPGQLRWTGFPAQRRPGC